MTIKVLKYQSWFDLAIQATGTAENAFLIAAANGANLTEAPKAGTSIFIPDTVLPEKKTLSYYNSRNLKPASDVDNDDDGEGIEFWYVDYDFVVLTEEQEKELEQEKEKNKKYQLESIE